MRRVTTFVWIERLRDTTAQISKNVAAEAQNAVCDLVDLPDLPMRQSRRDRFRTQVCDWRWRGRDDEVCRQFHKVKWPPEWLAV